MAIAINITELKNQVEVLGWKRKDIKEHYGFTTQAACDRMLKAAGIKFPAFRPDDSFVFVTEEAPEEILEEVQNISEEVVEEQVEQIVEDVVEQPSVTEESVLEVVQQVEQPTVQEVTSVTQDPTQNWVV